ncbi:MAG: hypothetical protein P8X51_18475, partial [Maritimibacter sp.]
FWLWWTFIGFTVHYRWHQEIRLVISTPDGPVEAASVLAVDTRYHPYSSGLSTKEVNRDQRGEAVVADLGNGRYLFALLPSPALAEIAYVDLPPNRPDIYRAIRRQVGEAAIPLPRNLYPRLVTFTDIADPASVALVDPDNLAASFGPGYALERITVAITDAPVTEGVVEGVLGWWLNYRHGPYNEMMYLQLPDNSPRGWEELGASSFWSLDLRLKFDEAYNGK